MAGSLGTIRGQIRLDVANAIAGYAAVRAANASTINTMNDARNRMRGFGVAAVGMGAAFLTGFGMAVNAAADFEKKLDYFGAVNNATAGEMEKVRAKALELGKTSVYSASQIADALVEMGKAGVSAKDITDGMADAMVNLAQAADIELAQATNIVTSAIQSYELSAKDAVHVTDLMAGAANASIIDITDIGVSMKYVAGVANSLGISIDSTIDAISLLGKAGIKGSTAGTSLRQIMVSLAGGTNKAKGVLEDLGIITEDGANKFFTAEGKAKSLGEVFQILQDHTAGLSDKERIMAMRVIFNNRALAAAAILTKQGAAGFKEMNGEISKTTAAEVAAKRMDNLSGDIRRLKGSFETLLIEGGTPFQAFLRRIVQGLTRMIDMFSNLPRGLQTGILTFMLVAGVVLTIAGGIAIFGAAISGAIGAVGSFIGAMKMLGPIIWTAVKATWAMTTAALANPYVLLAMAVVALIAGLIILYKKSETFRNFIDGVGRALKAAFLATVDWFKGLPAFFGGVWDSISNAFSTGVDWVVKKWTEMIDWITSAPGRLWNSIVEFGSMIARFATDLPGKVGSALNDGLLSVGAFIQELPYMIGYWLGFALGTVVRWGIALAMKSAEIGTNTYNAVVDWFAKLPGRLAAFFVQIWNDFVAWGVNFLHSSKKWASDTYNGITEWFARLPGRIATFLLNLAVAAVKQYNDIKSKSVKFATDAYNGVTGWFAKLPARVATYIYTTGTNVRDGLGRAATWAGNAGVNIYNGLMHWLNQLPGKAWDIVTRVVDSFNGMIASAFNSAKQFASGLWDGFKAGLGINSPSYIEEALWAITRVAGEEQARLTKNVRQMQSLSRGLQEIRDNASSVKDQTLDTLRANLVLLDPTEGQLGLHPNSPDRLRRGASETRPESIQNQRPIHVTVNNPIAERASDSTSKKLRTLAAMGAF